MEDSQRPRRRNIEGGDAHAIRMQTLGLPGVVDVGHPYKIDSELHLPVVLRQREGATPETFDPAEYGLEPNYVHAPITYDPTFIDPF